MRSTFKVLFYLKRSKDTTVKIAPVMGRITINGEIAQFSAKLSVPVELWETAGGGRAKGRTAEADRINRHLDNIRGQINKHYQSIRDREAHVSVEQVKNAYLGIGKQYRTLVETADEFVKAYVKRADRARNSKVAYTSCVRHLKLFLKKKLKVSNMWLDSLEPTFSEEFHAFLSVDCGFAPNTVSSYIKNLKFIIKTAYCSGWMKSNPFALYHYIPPQVDRGYLTEAEINRLLAAELKRPRQRIIRDTFLFSCFTGICYADMCLLTERQFAQDVHGDWWVSDRRLKTGTVYKVKLLPVAVRLFEKYRPMRSDAPVFPMLHLVTMNMTLKTIAKICKIDKRISFHLGRHTYATTICLSNGISLEALSKMLGHKHVSTTQIYAKVTQPMIDREIDSLKDKLEGRFAVC